MNDRLDIVNENPEGLYAAARQHPAFRHLCGKSLTRYALRGVLVNGVRVKLGVIRVGGRLLTSAAALDRFLAEMNQSPPESLPAPRSPSARLKSSERAAAELTQRMAGV